MSLKVGRSRSSRAPEVATEVKTKTGTRVAIAIVVGLALGLAAYGYGFGFSLSNPGISNKNPGLVNAGLNVQNQQAGLCNLAPSSNNGQGRCYPGCTVDSDCSEVPSKTVGTYVTSYDECIARATALCSGSDPCIKGICGPHPAVCRSGVCSRPNFSLTMAQCANTAPGYGSIATQPSIKGGNILCQDNGGSCYQSCKVDNDCVAVADNNTYQACVQKYTPSCMVAGGSSTAPKTLNEACLRGRCPQPKPVGSCVASSSGGAKHCSKPVPDVATRAACAALPSPISSTMPPVPGVFISACVINGAACVTDKDCPARNVVPGIWFGMCRGSSAMCKNDQECSSTGSTGSSGGSPTTNPNLGGSLVTGGGSGATGNPAVALLETRLGDPTGPVLGTCTSKQKDVLVPLIIFYQVTSDKALQIGKERFAIESMDGGFVKGSKGTPYFTNIKLVASKGATVVMGPVELASGLASSSQNSGTIVMADPLTQASNLNNKYMLTAWIACSEDAKGEFFGRSYRVVKKAMIAGDVSDPATGAPLEMSKIIPPGDLIGTTFKIAAQ